ncbi:MAG: hypothetical protein D6800_09540, partial [Candidatus Zixiibacteriota bacterium]
LGPLSYLRGLATGETRFYSQAGTDLRASTYQHSRSFELLRGGGVGRPLEHLYVYGSAVLDEARAKDPNYTGKKWRGLAGDVDYAFARYRTPRFELLVGRFASFWGLRRSLVLEGQNLDGLGYRFDWGKLTISYRLARLDGTATTVGNGTEFENRYFAGHRFDFHFSPQVRVGLFETVVFGGAGRQISLYYLNPLIFFHGSQLNEGINDNTFVGFDFTVKPKRNMQLYGQLLVDDFQIDNRTQADQEPNEYAVRGGAFLVDLLPRLDFRVEYTRVTNRTFNQNLPRNRYLFKGAPLSDVRGNDYDELSFEFTRWFHSTLALVADFSYWRQGEGRISDPWTQPWLDIQGPYHEPFPTGVVQKTVTAAMGAKGFAGRHVFFDFSAGFESVRNLGHVNGLARTRPFVRAVVSTLFAVPVSFE